MSIDCTKAIHVSNTHKTGLSWESCLTQGCGAEQLSSGSGLAKGDGPAGGRLAAAEEVPAQPAEHNPFWLASLMEKQGSPMNTCLDAFILGISVTSFFKSLYGITKALGLSVGDGCVV